MINQTFYLYTRIANLKKVILVLFFFPALLSCSSNKKPEENSIKRTPLVDFEVNLTIGSESQPDQYQLGDPIGILTDSLGNIYIADRATLKIKKFDTNGTFLDTIGRRGRGPGEFHDINTFELTPEGNFFIVDKGNIRYTIITPNGEEVLSKKIDISNWQFYPNDVEYLINGDLLSLYQDPNRVTALTTPMLQRNFFYVHTSNLETKRAEFFPYSELKGLQEKFAWVNFIETPGTFVLQNKSKKPEIIYSPRLYTGNFYKLTKNKNEWDIVMFEGSKPSFNTFSVYTEAEFNEATKRKVPGITRTYFDQLEPYRGRVNSADEGIFVLSDGRIIQFRSEWSDLVTNNKPDSTSVLDIRVQIFDENYQTYLDSYLFSINTQYRLWKPIINWKDKDDNFYYLHVTKDSVLVKRFHLSLN